MGNLFTLDIPQRVQRLISLVPSLPRLRQRARKVTLSLFFRFRELGDETISRDSRATDSMSYRYGGRMFQRRDRVGNYRGGRRRRRRWTPWGHEGED